MNLFVIYDGIENSVFQSQVLLPIQEMLSSDVNLKILLVSFENKRFENKNISYLFYIDRLEVIIYKNFRIFSMLSLVIPIYRLFRLISQKSFDQVTARGPIAGFVLSKALSCIKKKRYRIYNSSKRSSS